MLPLLLLLALIAASPAHAEGPVPDYVASSGVAHVANHRVTGAGQGGGLHGNRLLVSGPSQLTVFDASIPQSPVLLGTAPLGAANESEDIPSDGRWAAVAEAECLSPSIRGGCIAVFDVTAAPQRIASLRMNVQTVACVLGCRYLWAPGENAIVDMADPAAPKEVGTFLDPADERLERGCVSAREVHPGVVMVACDPVFALSTLPEHGGSPTRPALVGLGDTDDFQATPFTGGVPHGARWTGARDRFMLTTTETPFSGACGSDSLGAFVVWDAQPVLARTGGFRPLDLWRPTNGTYLDGRSPYNAVGCSPHFLAEHPSFRDGGLVAVAALENGLRFLQVGPDGKIEERAYFLGAGGTSALPIWHPDGRTVYVVDYARGLDILDYTGHTYVPPAPPAAAGQTARPEPEPGMSPRPLRFRVLGVIRNGRGRATIAVETPGPGTLRATPKAKGVRLRRLRADVRQAGLTTLTVVAGGKAKRVLRRKRRLAVDVRISWRPQSGAARTARQRVVLRASR